MDQSREMKKVSHYHHCPNCYNVFECYMDCTIDPYLDDPISYPDMQFGSYCQCFECEPIKGRDGKGREVEEYSQEWWLRYNGFIK